MDRRSSIVDHRPKTENPKKTETAPTPTEAVDGVNLRAKSEMDPARVLRTEFYVAST